MTIILKARSHDPFLRIQFLVPKTGSRRSDGPISRFRFSVENVGRSFAVCSHDPFFRTNKESSIWRQTKIVGVFHLSRRVLDEDRACSISIRFFKIEDPFDGRSFLMCPHDPFFGTNKNRILKNGSCERALKETSLDMASKTFSACHNHKHKVSAQTHACLVVKMISILNDMHNFKCLYIQQGISGYVLICPYKLITI